MGYSLLLEMCRFPILYHGLIWMGIWGTAERPLSMNKVEIRLSIFWSQFWEILLFPCLISGPLIKE